MISKDNVIIDSVALVDGLKHKLLSISQLYDKGNEVWFTKEAWVISDKTTRNILLTGKRKGNVHVADFISTSFEGMTCLFSKSCAEESWLWHKKLSHFNFKAMNLLVKKDLVRGLRKLEFTKDGLCDAFQKVKQRKASFKSKIESSIDEPLQLLHMHLVGPINIMSIGKKKYCLVIVDDFKRFYGTFFLHSKDEASQIIINHIKVVENGTKWRVKKIRTDNGIEFKNSSIKNFYDEKGVAHTFSALGTPQQNGVVERKNRNLIEAARTMLEESKLSTYFWDEAINTACYTQNISIVNRAHDKTAYQLMKNKNPTINFLHVFGCECLVLKNQGDNLGKFEAKANETIFDRYASTRSYGGYNLGMNIVMESVHVVFDDKKIPGLLDEGNHDTLQFENEYIGDTVESDEEDNSYGKSVSVDVIPSMDNPHPSMDNLSFDKNISTGNASIDKSSSRNLNSFSRSMNLGGASQSQRSFTNKENPLNDQEAFSSRSNLPPQRKWTKSHPFELIIGDAGDGIKTRSATQMNVYTTAFFLKKSQRRLRKHFMMLIEFLICKKNLISLKDTKYGSWCPSLKIDL